ncbi:MAG TPA: helix-turn-helix domain-containing protein [Thermoanaerobaculia bacterium]|nr:helix-turn-helix domain-containing protein [Thermoanaerobaculia bacterium]
MAETDTSDRKLYTLSEISQRTGISMPTLQRYKKMYQARIPAEGKGRKQRYPEESLPVFEQLRVENAGRRGRPRKDASAARPAASGAAGGRGRGRKAAAPAAAPAAKRGRGRKAAAKPAKAAAKPAATRGGARGTRGGGRKAAASGGRSNLLTLGQVSEQTGISYPTLVRYVRLHSNRLPSEGTGRSRRFHPEAVAVFSQLRSESGRGGRKPAAAKATRGPGRGGRGRAAAESSGTDTSHKRLKALEKAQQDLEKRFRGFVTSLQKLFR